MSIISKAAFAAALNRLGNTPATVDNMARYALMHGATSQLTPANQLIERLNMGGLTRGDVGKAALAMLGEGLQEFATMGATGAKARKGAEWLSQEAATAAALAIKGIEARMAGFSDTRKAAQEKRAADKAAGILIKAAAPQAPQRSILGAALEAIGAASTAEGAAMAQKVGETRNAEACAVWALAGALAGAPGMLALFKAALPMVQEAAAAQEAAAVAHAAKAAAEAAEGVRKAAAEAAEREAARVAALTPEQAAAEAADKAAKAAKTEAAEKAAAEAAAEWAAQVKAAEKAAAARARKAEKAAQREAARVAALSPEQAAAEAAEAAAANYRKTGAMIGALMAA